MFIHYDRIPDKARMEDIIFSAFEKIRIDSNKKRQIQRETIQKLIKEFGFEKDQEQLLFTLGVERSNEDEMKEIKERVFSRLSYKQDLFELLKNNLSEEEKNEVLKRNNKIHMIYNIHKIIQEGNMKSWINIMKDYSNDGKITKEDMGYIKEHTQNARDDFYQKRETDKRFSSILESIEEEQNDSGSTIGDYVHMTRNRVAHGVYHSTKSGENILKSIIKNMTKEDIEEAKNLLQEKRGDFHYGLTDFDRRFEKELGKE